MVKKAPLVLGGLILGASVIGGVAYALTRKNEEEEPEAPEAPEAQFRGLTVDYGESPSSPAIEKFTYDIWGVDLTFEHRGIGGTFVVGFAVAYDVIFGHAPPFDGSAKQVTIPDEIDWASHIVELRGVVPADIETHRFIDVIAYISDAFREANQDPTNPYGVNVWKDNIYVVIGTPTFAPLSVVYI